MKTASTFGVSFILRISRSGAGYIYARITVDGSRSELGLKQQLDKKDWNVAKGMARPKDARLRQFNEFLESVKEKFRIHYQKLMLSGELLTAESVRDAFIGANQEKREHTVNWLCEHHNTVMKLVLKPGTLKNYFATQKYLNAFMQANYGKSDLPLSRVTYEFISGFEFHIRSTPLKDHDGCTNNGTMKHIERLKKMIRWAAANEWMEKDTGALYKLKFKKVETEFLRKEELERVEKIKPGNTTIALARDIFVFSCYTGLSYIDALSLRRSHFFQNTDKRIWLVTQREKTGTPVHLPLLSVAVDIYRKYVVREGKNGEGGDNFFPAMTNQEINRNLKIIAEICSISKKLTFHMARHTFATTVTLMNGVPIESISKMLGHTKLSTTMIYSKITMDKVGNDMELLQQRMNAQ